MRRRIVINATGSNNWTGGLYYKKNIAFVLQNNDYIVNNYEIVFLVDANSREFITASFPGTRIINLGKSVGIVNKIKKTLLLIAIKGECLFPTEAARIPFCKSIHWFADFQHKYYPEYFTEEEQIIRENYFQTVACSSNPLVLSSKDAEVDFRKFYGGGKKNVYVVPFVSYIENEVKCSQEDIELVIRKYSLYNITYVVVMNQFWQHKNHIIVFEAIKKLLECYPDTKIQFVFTGMMEDYRTPDYIDRLKKLIDNPIIASHIKMLGFISRGEQIAIMKNAAFVIQPSLFEGWGTVVEDSKVLDKTILLSDIPVHREQMNEKCILFDPHDPTALAELIYEESQKNHYDDIEKGIADMYKRAKEYSKGFEQMLKDLENMR